jgi:hypothetical protein
VEFRYQYIYLTKEGGLTREAGSNTKAQASNWYTGTGKAGNAPENDTGNPGPEIPGIRGKPELSQRIRYFSCFLLP